MANITKRMNKAGATSYRIRVFINEGVDGKQKMRSMTWTPPANMRASAADKQAQKTSYQKSIGKDSAHIEKNIWEKGYTK